MGTYIDRRGDPAVRIAFGYSRTDPQTAAMLFVSDERVVWARMTEDEVRANFMETSVPLVVAIRKLNEVMSTGGATFEARRLMWFIQNEPIWMLRLMDALIAMKTMWRNACLRAVNATSER